jgi:bifunctional UDP-N-acetylglucosamine pyrophosphorylase/glucosamine-1-phosphate N-acetyltransferase
MKAMVLAAGEGTRLRPLTSNIPKPLLMLAGKPYLQHLFEGLRDAGVEDIYLLVGWKANRVREHFGDGGALGVRIHYLEQKERMGTAHAVGVADGVIAGEFLCVNGDVLLSPRDIKALAEEARHGGSVMAVARVDDPSRFGVVEESEGRMLRIHEKPRTPPSDIVNAGAFAFTPRIFDLIRRTGLSPRGEYEITDTLNMLCAEEEVRLLRLRDHWLDVGLPWDLLRANELLMRPQARRVDGDVEEGAHLIGPVVVEKGARVRSGSYVEGPAYISEGCDVGPNCYIRPSTCLGRGVRVGASVEVKNSIIMAGTHIPHHNYVGDSVIGERCNLGAGTKIANLRFDGRPVKVSMNGATVDSGLRKLGVIMGDDVKTGINSMVEPGTVIWERAIIGAGATAKGCIAPDSKVN